MFQPNFLITSFLEEKLRWMVYLNIYLFSFFWILSTSCHLLMVELITGYFLTTLELINPFCFTGPFPQNLDVLLVVSKYKKVTTLTLVQKKVSYLTDSSLSLRFSRLASLISVILLNSAVSWWADFKWAKPDVSVWHFITSQTFLKGLKKKWKSYPRAKSGLIGTICHFLWIFQVQIMLKKSILR